MGVHPRRPRHGLSLCAGYGGLDLGLQLAEPGFHTRCFVEIDPDAQAALVAGMVGGHLPRLAERGAGSAGSGRAAAADRRARPFRPAPVWDDLRTFVGLGWRGHIDAILAGYPCQPFSAAGQRRGADDERHLWPDVARIAREVAPEWLFLENVAGHVSLGLETVLRDIWRMGYTPAAGLFSAGETGATHERLRVFIVAHRHADADAGGLAGRGNQDRPTEGQSLGAERQWLRPGHRGGGNAGHERLDDSPRHDGGLYAGSGPEGFGTADAGRAGGHFPNAQRGRPWLHPPGPAEADRWADVIGAAPYLAPAASLRDCLAWAGDMAAALEGPGGAAIESAVCLLADGLARRARALRGLGNGVHPLAAGYAWRSLANAHGLRPLDLDAAGERPGDRTAAENPVLMEADA